MRDAESLLDQLVSVGEGKVTTDLVVQVLGIPDLEVFFALTDAIAEEDTGRALCVLADAFGLTPPKILEQIARLLG